MLDNDDDRKADHSAHAAGQPGRHDRSCARGAPSSRCRRAEDTRVTGKLLAHFGIENRLERCDENVIAAKSPALVSRMLDGEEVAFCSDAGMPGISDPGCVLVDAAREAGVPVDVLRGRLP